MADQQLAETVASRSFDFTVEEKKTVNATLSLKRYPLKLRSAFGYGCLYFIETFLIYEIN